MIFHQLNTGSCRSYLIGHDGAPEVIIVDPRLEFVPEYLKLLEKNHWRLTHVLDTHTHADHVSGATLLVKETACQYLMHRLSPVTTVSERIEDGTVLDVGGTRVQALYTPGHSHDSLSLWLPDKILTGDTLFLDDGGAGRDDLYGGDPGEHFDSLQRLGSLPDNLVVYPAHEYRGRTPSSLAEQKKHNPYLRYETKVAFVDFAHHQKFGAADWMAKVVQANIAGALTADAITMPTGQATCEPCTALVQGEPQNPCEPVNIPPAALNGISYITVSELQTDLAANPPVLLEVRESDELVGEYPALPGIVHIPVHELLSRVSELEANKNTTIISICKTGNRARTAAVLLLNQGFNDVKVLQGGMKAYREVEPKTKR